MIRLKSQGVKIYLVLRNVEILKQINELNIKRQLEDDEIFFEEIDAIQKAKEELRKYIKEGNSPSVNKKQGFLFHFKK